MTRVLCISDLHGWLPASLPDADVVVIAGDICPVENHALGFQRQWIQKRLRPWLERVAASGGRRVIWTWGNHDFAGQDSFIAQACSAWKIPPLIDQSAEIDGLVFHASPWTPTFHEWAFMADDEHLPEVAWRHIDPSVDVLITHGPAYSIGDRTEEGDLAGSRSLVPAIMQARPRLHVCGHIHEGFGVHPVDAEGQIGSVNASVRRRDYSIRCKAWMAQVASVQIPVNVSIVELERDYWKPKGASDEAPWGLYY